jgi:glycosyltransferase involved in cell wall biosynthesis
MKLTNHYAAFIMTYRRPEILNDTIVKLNNQTIPPSKILIIDNDPMNSASFVAEKHNQHNVTYFSTGYNAGPAGAAKIGLEMLSKEGFSWIAWIDDDNPPIFDNIFETLLNLANSLPKIGCVGTVGQCFNRNKGVMQRIPDDKLEGQGNIEVDNISGGMCKLVNTNIIIQEKIFPDEKLFYGFEELDFDLRIQNAGYHLLTDKELYKKHRLYYNRIGLQLERGKRKNVQSLWREYYSSRNILIILKKQKLYKALLFSITRSTIKIIIGFRFGLNYGFKNAKLISLALYHFLFRKSGSLKQINQ